MVNLIWDLDGTLIDSQQELLNSLNFALLDAGIDSAMMIKPFIIGPTIDVILKTAFPEEYLTDDKLNKAVNSFRQHYDNSSFLYTLPFTGIDEIINDTNSYAHYIITNKPDMPSKKILDKLGWKNKITAVLTPYTFGNAKKTKAQLFEYLVSHKKLDSTNTYAIGDMYTDYLAAQSAGLKTIGVLWGSGTQDELSKCSYLCSSVFELKELLKTL